MVLCVLSFMANTASMNAQTDDSNRHRQSSIYLTGGSVIFLNQYSLAYERSVFHNNMTTSRLKVNYGKYGDSHGDLETGERLYKNYIGLSGVQLIKFIELNAGIAFTEYSLAKFGDLDPNVDYDETKKANVFHGSLGIRITNKGFMLRTGFGNLELIYLGIGVNF